MDFMLQQGYGMKRIDEEFAKKYEGLGVILSPRSVGRNSSIEKLEEHSLNLQKRGVKILFDPQFYIPKTNLDKLLRFPYFNYSSFETIEFNDMFNEDFCKKAIEYQINKIKARDIIIPGRYTNSINDQWYEMHENFIRVANEMEISGDRIMTLALGVDVIKNQDMFDELINKCINYPVDGFYVVLKTPKFLIDDQEYIYALLDGLLSISVANKKIILGYANQESIFWSSVGIDCLATGNYRNVRAFDPEIFMEDDDDDIRRRGIWYFDVYSFGEYKKQQLSLASRRGLNDKFGPKCEYCKELLESSNPSNIVWKEPMSFKHYLFEMKNIVEEINSVDKSLRIDFCIEKINKIQEHNKMLVQKGFNLGDKGFDINVSEAILSALEAIKTDRSLDLQQL